MSNQRRYNLQSALRSALRRLWLLSPMRTAALQGARISRGLYRCATCKDVVRSKDIAVDHIDPVTPVTGFDSWDGFIERLFCPPSKLAVVCKTCHAKKTKEENATRRQNKKK